MSPHKKEMFLRQRSTFGGDGELKRATLQQFLRDQFTKNELIIEG